MKNITCNPWHGLLAVMFATATFAAASARAAQAVDVQVAFDQRLGPLNIDRMALGQGGLSEEPMWDNRIIEIRALKPRIIRLFIQEYFDLLPAPGRYQFETLDRSVATIRQTGAQPLMCICFKPRVLFPKIDHRIVEPNDYPAWEELIFKLVTHYKEQGGAGWHWEVANEPDLGESGGCPYLFQPDSYGRYYRHTVAAILRADPSARVGGPAVAGVRSPILPALMQTADADKIPLHFISWHIYSSSPGAVRETIQYAKELLSKHPALELETFLDEWNMDLTNPPLDPRFQPCYVAETIWQMKDAGFDYSCYYHIRDYYVSFDRFTGIMSPTGTAFMARWWNRMPQFDGLFDYQNTLRPTYFTFKLLSRLEGERLKMTVSGSAIHGFATRDDRLLMENLLLWNFSDKPVSVAIAVSGLTQGRRARHIVLDALAPGSDENTRLRPDPYTDIKPGQPPIRLEFEPYAVHYWSFE